MEKLWVSRSHGGMQGMYRHPSSATGTEMEFSVFVPEHAPGEKLPILWYLSGLNCTPAIVAEKGEYRRACAQQGIIFVAPDTSPRGPGVPDNGAHDFGQGASAYLDATEAPWSAHFRMQTYLEGELPRLIGDEFPADLDRQGIVGHSMGGHGSLTIGLRNPGRFRSISALAPIVAPSQVAWGQAALTGYLGSDRTAWRAYDAVALIEDGARPTELLIDIGSEYPHLDSALRPELLAAACRKAGVQLTLRLQPGYDHSYYFVSTFLAEHVAWHAKRLKA